MTKKDKAEEAEETERLIGSARPNDIPIEEPGEAPLGGNSTFASRAKAQNRRVKADQTTSK